MDAVQRPPRPNWTTVLFVLLLLVNLVPLQILFRLGGASFETAEGDREFLIALLITIAAPAIALAGVIGTRRGWSWAALVPIGLVAIGWPAFIAWMLMNFPKC